MLFLGFSAGIPILLIFSTLSVWLREAGVERSAVTFFSWAALGYSFKFVWAPLLDLLPLPFLTKRLGRRRGWLLVTQGLILVAIVAMAAIDPAVQPGNLTWMACAAVLLGFSSASQDVVIDAYRIECADQSLQALLSSMYIAGYRLGMLLAGAGSLFLAEFLGSAGDYHYPAWRATYVIMAAMMGVGMCTTLAISEPAAGKRATLAAYPAAGYLRLLAVLLLAMGGFAATFFWAGQWLAVIDRLFPGVIVGGGGFPAFVGEVCRFFLAVVAAALIVGLATYWRLVDREMAARAYYRPVRDFFDRYGLRTALLLLLLIGCYRLSDIVLGVVANVFYLDMGFSKSVIAGITKSFGLAMTLIGGFLGGVLTLRYGIDRILFLGALLSAATNLLFMALAGGSELLLLTVVIAADNLSAGIAATAFVAFLSSLTNISFTAVQYAIFSSMMTLLPKVVGGYSGTMVTALGYQHFFLLTALIGLPVLGLIVWATRAARGR